ncbi:alpha/beta hydrolase [Saccharopolyspora sp. WRP15-2]|uniref:Alpha/beta hydrolase n=1 Tax=Saccharopolyspora oryzae TaxID=2997343 RepID=A0ABT4UY62_9PSEU|nr:alpha/beta hydrolase [Saccharopolyspora oryzae]MDA3626493.1 alpha/beta hydrolase [Saccharopolyspora oryzae]
MTTVANIRQWKPALLDEAIDDLKREEDRLVRLDDELATSGKPAEWQGEAAKAAEDRHRDLGEKLRELVVEVAAVRRALIENVDEVQAVQRQLAEADSLASSYRFRICDDGRIEDLEHVVVGGPGSRLDEEDRYRIQQVRPDLVDRVERLLAQADDADAELTKVLRDADLNLMETGEGGSLADAAALGDAHGLAETVEPPPPGTPADNARWWESLPAETRAAMAEAPPPWLGNMDGIPATIRHTANVNRLDDERVMLQAQAAQLRSKMDKPYPGPGGRFNKSLDQAELDRVDAKLKSLDEIEKVLGPERDQRQLLVMDSSGERMKAAVATGDVDTAKHVAVFTPGLESAVEKGSLQDYDLAMEQLRQDAQRQSFRYGDSGEVAAVTWIGYEAPQLSEIPEPSDSVASASSAKRGAEDLANFYRGINESRSDDPHLVALGHSYGSTTTGYALQQEGTGVDDAVVMGSPGLGTPLYSGVNVPDGHTYNLESDWDPVADLGRFGADPSDMPSVDNLSTQESVSADGQQLSRSVGHNTGGGTGYLDAGTTSQYNVSVVVSGLPERAVDAKE